MHHEKQRTMFDTLNSTKMLKYEFDKRVFPLIVSDEEYNEINAEYEASDLDKDVFCRRWRMRNRSRIAQAKEELQKPQYLKYSGKYLAKNESQMLSFIKEEAEKVAEGEGWIKSDLEVDFESYRKWKPNKFTICIRDKGSFSDFYDKEDFNFKQQYFGSLNKIKKTFTVEARALTGEFLITIE